MSNLGIIVNVRTTLGKGGTLFQPPQAPAGIKIGIRLTMISELQRKFIANSIQQPT